MAHDGAAMAARNVAVLARRTLSTGDQFRRMSVGVRTSVLDEARQRFEVHFVLKTHQAGRSDLLVPREETPQPPTQHLASIAPLRKRRERPFARTCLDASSGRSERTSQSYLPRRRTTSAIDRDPRRGVQPAFLGTRRHVAAGDLRRSRSPHTAVIEPVPVAAGRRPRRPAGSARPGPMRKTVWVDDWQMHCCGDPFEVGARDSWTLVPPEREWLATFLGEDQASRISDAEDHHARVTEDDARTRGTVKTISAVYCRFLPRPGDDDRTLYPALGSVEVEARAAASGWEKELDGLRFVGYVVQVDAR